MQLLIPIRRVSSAFLLGLGLCSALALPAHSAALAAAPSLSVAPTAVQVGQMVTVSATNVYPRTTLFLLLVPDYQKPKWQRLMGYVRSNAAGRVVPVQLRVPQLKHCGPASLLLFSPKQKSIRARVTVSGCNGSPGAKGTATVPAPPPPPSKKKGH